MARKVRLFIQPVYNYTDNKIKYAEVLIREYRGITQPDKILKFVARHEIEYKFDMDVVKEALYILECIKLDYPVSINITAKTVEQEGTALDIIKLIKSSQVNPNNIIIEINECADFNDINVINNLKAFNKYGIKIALDDFGTGQTNLLSFVNNRFDIIKIARNFITTDNWLVKKELLQFMIALSHKIKFETIVEGVETPDVLKELQDMGLDNIQGYIYSKPMSIANYMQA